MFNKTFSRQTIVENPLNKDDMAAYQTACDLWRKTAKRYSLYVLLALGLSLLMVPTLSWPSIYILLAACFVIYTSFQYKLSDMIEKEKKVSVVVDDEQFARPYDDNHTKPMESLEDHAKSEDAKRYVKQVTMSGRVFTNLDLDIVTYLNDSEKQVIA